MISELKTTIVLAVMISIIAPAPGLSSDDIVCIVDDSSHRRQSDQRAAGIIRVPADQPTIQAGVDAAVDGDTVLVADGTWSGPGNRLINFNGKEIVVRSENGRERCLIDLDGEGPAFILQSGEGLDAEINSCIIYGNDADTGAQCYAPSGSFDVRYSDVEDGWPGTGNINAVPWMCEGPFGYYYLSHRDAGQAFDSPCIDAGDPTFNLYPASTRTDGEWDTTRADMNHDGFDEIVVGGGPDPDLDTPVVVLDYSSGEGLFPLCGFQAFPYGYTHGATVSAGRI